MESTMFYLGMGTIIVCVLALSPALLLYVKTKKILHLYICLLLANYLIELVELLYIARFCLPEDIRYFNLIHFPVLRIFTTVSTLLLDLLILLRIMNLKFHKSCLLLFAAVALFCAYTAWLPQTLLTIWLFYMPRQICHFGYGIFFLIRRGLEKDEAVRKRMERCSFLVLGVFLLSVSILLEDSLLISHIQTYFTDMLSVTERNFSENILWLFIMLCSMVYCVRELEQGGTSAVVSGSGRTSGLMPAAAGAEQNSGIGMASEAARFGYLAAVSEEYKFTPREIQILDCILQYKTTAEICEELNISTGTVKTHTHNIYMKANVKSRQELIRALTKTR
ncbi:LuxR family transcriptional regulator [Lachnospiraceae bacterium]|nr:LuxR family transcriptional regulator [Lachnospiraceae bacterium]